MQSILQSIKKLLGIDSEDSSFDQDIIMHINTVFATLNQLGVGPEEGFYIEDDYTLWTDFIDEGAKLESIKPYVYLKVKLMFDPPLSSTVIESINRTINELEWRINISSESTS